MVLNIKYVHTNLIARDWKKLAEFYINVFGCKPVYPERDMSGDWIEKLTQIKDVHVKGMHLRLPGHEENGPTLEIFEYNDKSKNDEPNKINNYGFGHIAFLTDNVEELLERVIENGGSKYGELIRTDIAGVNRLTCVYLQDPEGNIIELQKWG